jgi:chromosome segregation ATPase
LADEREQFKEKAQREETRFKDLENKLQAKEKELHEKREEHLRMDLTLQSLKQQNADLRDQLTRLDQATKIFSDKSIGNVYGELTKEQQMQVELGKLRMEAQNLREELRQVTNNFCFIFVFGGVC